ncbi:MAG: hypothetical protein JSU74_13445 [Candidatus Zixiibacteriota bacterium]|nr:MAG: hypothetical protein JSU74_13445 [candidate division Zixibacteria bacterium]
MERHEMRIAPRISINEVRLTDGSRVSFDITGARYLSRSEVIKGLTEDGVARKIKIGDVDSLFYTGIDDSVNYAQSGAVFKESHKVYRKKSIRGVIRGLSTRYYNIEFDKYHGQIDTLARAVVGVTTAGNAVSVPIDSVYSISLERFDAGKSFLTTAAIMDVVWDGTPDLYWEYDLLEEVLDEFMNEDDDN